MNDLTVKSPAYTDASGTSKSTRDKDALTEELATAFQNLVTKMGTTVDAGTAAMASKAGLSNVNVESDQSYHQEASYRDNSPPDRENSSAGDHNDYHDDPYKGERQDSNRDTSVSNRSDDRGRDDAPARTDNSSDRSESRADDKGDRSSDNSNESKHSDNQGSDKGSDNNQNAADGDNNSGQQEASAESANPAANAADGGAQTGNQGATAQASALAGNITAVEALANAGSQAAANTTKTQTTNNATLVNAGTQGLGAEGQASEQGKAAAMQGLAGGSTQKSKGQAQQGANASATQGQANANTAQTAGANQANAGAQNANTDNAGKQAADLAKTLGNTGQVQVNVEVTDEADSFSSRPTSSLTAATVSGDSSKNQSGAGQNNGSNQSGNQNAAAAMAQNTQNAQNQNQQAGGSSGQGGNVAQLGDARGAAQATGQTGGTATAQTGEGSATTTNTATGGTATGQHTQQTQQTAETQAKNPLRNPLPGQSVTDQVSVKISKALAAGNDKIKIQLSPAELGRVEVKMELTNDGRAMAVVSADNRETLDLLRRDASDLQKALAEAGIDLSSSDMEFNLSGQEGQMAENEAGSMGSGRGGEEEEISGDQGEVMMAHEMGVLANGRIDVRA